VLARERSDHGFSGESRGGHARRERLPQAGLRGSHRRWTARHSLSGRTQGATARHVTDTRGAETNERRRTDGIWAEAVPGDWCQERKRRRQHHRQLFQLQAKWPVDLVGGGWNIAYAMLKEMNSENVTQAMLAVQMIGTHYAALGSLLRAASGPQSPDHPDIYMERATRWTRFTSIRQARCGSCKVRARSKK